MYDLVTGVFYTNSGTGTFVAGPIKKLPKEYQEIEYLESTGTQYINTDVSYDSNNIYKCKFMISNLAYPQSNYSGIMGKDGTLQIAYTSNGIWQTGNGSGGTSKKNTIYIGIADCSTQKLYINGVHVATRSSQNTSSSKIGILGYDYYRCYAKVYSASITNSGTLIRDYIPAKRKSDSVLGLYDLVTGTFYTNAGSGTFLGGQNITEKKERLTKSIVYNNKNVIRIEDSTGAAIWRKKNPFVFIDGEYKAVPFGYTAIDYIESISSGTQINTGMAANNKLFEIDLQFTNTTARQLMGIGPSSSEYWGINNNTWEKVGNSNSVPVNSRCMIMYDVNNLGSYKTNTWIKGSTTKFEGSTATSTFTNEANSSFVIFKLTNTDSYYCYMKLFGLRVYNASSIKVADFIPVRRNSDSALGLYNLLNNTFYTNSGTGSFISGPTAQVF